MKKIKQGFVVESDWETALVWPVKVFQIKLSYGLNGKWNNKVKGKSIPSRKKQAQMPCDDW